MPRTRTDPVRPRPAGCPSWCTIHDVMDEDDLPVPHHFADAALRVVVSAVPGGPVLIGGDHLAGHLTVAEARQLARDLRAALRLVGAAR